MSDGGRARRRRYLSGKGFETILEDRDGEETRKESSAQDARRASGNVEGEESDEKQEQNGGEER